ncbi:MAG: TraM recognition domain-containing protein, partial [Patescibacteria group bacterium]|nr:TraM recognition domain-containing protein [Patescibacteria group bacterium]
NAFALGLILAAKLQAEILKRAKLSYDNRSPFYLYVDEFQNLTTDSFASMLSESRKYGLGVHLTNQYFAQLPENLQQAVLGNVGTILAFQVGMEDAEKLEKEFYPLTKDDLVNLQRYHFHLKLMINGQSSQPFSGVSLPPTAAEASETQSQIRALTRLAYGQPKLLVEEQIKRRMAVA